jgi:hypothetical protein
LFKVGRPGNNFGGTSNISPSGFKEVITIQYRGKPTIKSTMAVNK